MDVAAFIDGTVAFIVIGTALWAIGALFALSLCRAGALEDEVMARYLAEQYGQSEPAPDPYDDAARDWIAHERQAS